MGGDLVVRQPRAREDGQLLPPDEGVHHIDARDPGLDELARLLPRVRVHRIPDDLEPLLARDLGAAVARLAEPVKDPPQQFVGDRQLGDLAQELHAGLLDVHPHRRAEDLDDGEPLAGVEHLALAALPVRELDLDDLPVGGVGDVADEEQRTRDPVDRAVLDRHGPVLRGGGPAGRHQASPEAAVSVWTESRISVSTASNWALRSASGIHFIRDSFWRTGSPWSWVTLAPLPIASCSRSPKPRMARSMRYCLVIEV